MGVKSKTLCKGKLYRRDRDIFVFESYTDFIWQKGEGTSSWWNFGARANRKNNTQCTHRRLTRLKLEEIFKN